MQSSRLIFTHCPIILLGAVLGDHKKLHYCNALLFFSCNLCKPANGFPNAHHLRVGANGPESKQCKYSETSNVSKVTKLPASISNELCCHMRAFKKNSNLGGH
uniref:Secreted protein n=1 Tax=Rhipicephalus appendiculatus TaxID=34631 RepID=A0A131YB32_RHIAP